MGDDSKHDPTESEPTPQASTPAELPLPLEVEELASRLADVANALGAAACSLELEPAALEETIHLAEANAAALQRLETEAEGLAKRMAKGPARQTVDFVACNVEPVHKTLRALAKLAAVRRDPRLEQTVQLSMLVNGLFTASLAVERLEQSAGEARDALRPARPPEEALRQSVCGLKHLVAARLDAASRDLATALDALLREASTP